MKFLVLAIPLFAIGSPAADAQDTEGSFLFGHNLELASINAETEVTVEVYDSVSGGCWLNANRTKSSVERELLDAGYTNIVDETLFGATISIEVLGYATNDYQCAVSISSDLWLTDTDKRERENVAWVTFNNDIALSYGSLLTGPKSDMSNRIQNTVEGHIDEMVVDIQRAKNRLNTAILEAETTDSAKAYLSSLIE